MKLNNNFKDLKKEVEETNEDEFIKYLKELSKKHKLEIKFNGTNYYCKW